MPRFILLLLLVLSTQAGLADGWVHGSLVFLEVEGEVSVTQLGTDSSTISAEETPRPLKGLLNCEAGPAARVAFSASNRMFVEFTGEGSFSIERFEQVASAVQAWQVSERETGQSRMIYNFRSGQMLLDSRRMNEISHCLIEIPLGKITLRNALVFTEIYFDPRSQLFNFTLSCSQGRVRFSDNNDVTYTLRAGQRLAAMGSRMAPSIEVAEMTAQGRDRMAEFLKAVERNVEAANDLIAYQSRLEPIRDLSSPVTARRQKTAPDFTRRPIVIERARESQAVTPFRGEIPPPSADQADLF